MTKIKDSTISKYLAEDLTVRDAIKETLLHPEDLIKGVYGYPERVDTAKNVAWSHHQISDHIETNIGFMHGHYIILESMEIDKAIKSIAIE